MQIKIGTRTSDLARIQAQEVGAALTALRPDLSIEYILKKAEGDLDLKTPLFQLPDKGVFTRDLTELLIKGQIDLAVHSWKDLPLVDAGPTAVVGTLPRADMRDVIIFRKDRWERVCKDGQLLVLSSSPRRSYNLSTFLTWALPAKVNSVQFVPVRGNVQTRVRKLFEEDADALVVAKAALDRLVLSQNPEFQEASQLVKELLGQCNWIITPLCENPCAPAQGALAIEALTSRRDVLDLVAQIDCPADRESVELERRTLQGYGGGCHQKIGMAVISRKWGRVTFLRGLTDQGQVLNAASFEGCSPRPPRAKPETLWPMSESAAMFQQSAPLANVSLPVGNNLAFWIARASALPQDIKLPADRPCWTAGIQSWRKLAARGIWVNGCAESMGEQELPDLRAFVPGEIRWIKLSHQDAPRNPPFELLPTYVLLEQKELPDLSGKTHFYWQSGSQLEAALKHFPKIRQGWHACGPGNSYRKVLELIGDPTRVSISLNFESWRKEVLA